VQKLNVLHHGTFRGRWGQKEIMGMEFKSFTAEDAEFAEKKVGEHNSNVVGLLSSEIGS
jgi:hypothetical protein